jgi:hypothetical protein
MPSITIQHTFDIPDSEDTWEAWLDCTIDDEGDPRPLRAGQRDRGQLLDRQRVRCCRTRPAFAEQYMTTRRPMMTSASAATLPASLPTTRRSRRPYPASGERPAPCASATAPSRPSTIAAPCSRSASPPSAGRADRALRRARRAEAESAPAAQRRAVRRFSERGEPRSTLRSLDSDGPAVEAASAEWREALRTGL